MEFYDMSLIQHWKGGTGSLTWGLVHEKMIVAKFERGKYGEHICVSNTNLGQWF